MQEVPSKRKLAEADTSQQAPVFQSEVVFGIPWACKAFMQQACRVGHPSMREGSVPRELVTAVDKHVEWNAEQMASYRIAGCRCWIVRAKELEDAERLEKASRGCKVNQGQTSALDKGDSAGNGFCRRGRLEAPCGRGQHLLAKLKLRHLLKRSTSLALRLCNSWR